MTLQKFLAALVSLTLTLSVGAQHNCTYKIDTAAILNNKNLDAFVQQLQTDSFIVASNKKNIPHFIKKQLRCMANSFSIANPGKRYQATDVVIPRIIPPIPLPDRQLVFLAKSRDMLVMTYYKGGYGTSAHLLLIKFQHKKILDLWTGNCCFEGMATVAGIINTINKNKDKEWGLNTNIIIF